MARGVTDNVVKLMEQIAILGNSRKNKRIEISDVDIAIDGKTQFNLTFYFSEELINKLK
jgi:predicted nucleotidyltransferase